MLKKIPGAENFPVGVATKITGRHRKKVVEVEYLVQNIGKGERIEPQIGIEEIAEKLPDAINGQVGRGKDAEIIENIPVEISTLEMNFQGNYYDYKY